MTFSNSMYRDHIIATLQACRDPSMRTIDPALTECWMRLEFGTLDHLDRDRFRREVRIAAKLVRNFPKDTAQLASTYGLTNEEIAKLLGVDVDTVANYLHVELPAADAPFELFVKGDGRG